QGKISATSGMVRREAWLAGAKVLRRLDPAQFDAGLHLDLTRPARAGGPEPGLGGLLARTYTRTIFAPGLQADIRDQFTRFEDAMGRAPAFVDGHRHVH
ncbi:ChbG/HpnK family deacetylase, partial [Mycobacterium tuberculosis]